MAEPVTASVIDALADALWESFLELNPTTATQYGDERWADRLEDPGPAGRAAIRGLFERARADALAIDPDTLDDEGRITRDMMGVVAGIAIEDDDLGAYRLRAVDQIAGPQTFLPQLAQFQPADTPERLEAFLARLRGYEPYLEAYADILREGIAGGVTPARIVTERTIDQLRRMLALPPEAAIVPALARVADEAARERVREIVRDVVLPADRRFLDLLETEVLAASRPDPGLWSAPGGDELYRHAIRAWTTLDLDPADVHRIGLEELEAIDAERVVLAEAAGHGRDVLAYRAALAADPANLPGTPEALVARATEDIIRADEASHGWFGRLPRARCEVRRVETFREKDAPFAYYFPPTIDGTRPGMYYVNAYDMPSRTYSKLATTTYHEAIPGHHFQIALEMEHPSLNAFRRFGSRLVGSAYAEGWGLYAERLADELGLYRDAGERLGMLDAQAWRAARLVVDTGLHALRWTRAQAVEFLLAAGLARTDAEIETDRYIVWPGQALSYLIGMRVIRDLRRRLERRDAGRFDIRAFHDAVLGHGALPLATLERELPRWVAPA